MRACCCAVQVRRLLQRDPALRPTARQLAAARLFNARGNTTTAMQQGIGMSGLGGVLATEGSIVAKEETMLLEAGYLPKVGSRAVKRVQAT